MARSMMIIAACDGCGVRGPEEDFEMDVVLDVPRISRKPKEGDLCTARVEGGKNCFATFSEVLAPYFEMFRNSDAASRAPKPERQRDTRGLTPAEAGDPSLVCDFPGCDKGKRGGPYVAPTALGKKMHMARSHGARPESAPK